MRAITLVGFAIAMLSTAPAAAASTNVSVEACFRQFNPREPGAQLKQVRCVNKARRPEMLAQLGHKDLVDYLEAKLVAIAENIDRGRISPNEGAAEINQVNVAVTSEAQRRSSYQAQAQASQPHAAPAKTMMFCNTLGFSTICY